MVLRSKVHSSHRRRAGAFAATALVGLLTYGTTSSSSPAQDVESTRETLDAWVAARRSISAEQRDFVLGQAVLEDRIELVQREIASLCARIADAEASIVEADRVRAELLAEDERQRSTSAALADALLGMEALTRALLPRLPDPLRERIRPLSQRLPTDGQETRLALSERFQNVAGILNEVNRFQGEVTVVAEVRELADGRTAEVTTLYLGIGQAFYASADGSAAGVGRPTDSGWAFVAADQAAPAIGAALAILKQGQLASFVHLPIPPQ